MNPQPKKKKESRKKCHQSAENRTLQKKRGQSCVLSSCSHVVYAADVIVVLGTED